MSISDRILGKKNVNGHPHIEAVAPAAALPGGEVKILGTGLRPPELRRPSVLFGDMEAPVIISSDDFVVARVPQGAASGPVVISTNGHASNAHQVKVAGLIAENLHPVSNPAIDAEGKFSAISPATFTWCALLACPLVEITTGPDAAPWGTRATTKSSELIMTGASISPNNTLGRRSSGGRKPVPTIFTSPPGSAAAGATASMCGWPLTFFLPRIRSEIDIRDEPEIAAMLKEAQSATEVA